jgi:hypothetical protein
MTDITFDQPRLEPLGERGTTSVRTCLTRGVDFAELVLDNVDIQQGSVSVAVTTPAQQAALAEERDLKWATATAEATDTKVVDSMLFAALHELDKTTGPLVVMGLDNVKDIAAKEHSWSNLPHFKYKDTYLYYQRVADINSEADLQVLGLTVGYINSDLVIPLQSLPSDVDLTDETAASLASSVVGIINGAFHDETFTLWVRNDDQRF